MLAHVRAPWRSLRVRSPAGLRLFASGGGEGKEKEKDLLPWQSSKAEQEFPFVSMPEMFRVRRQEAWRTLALASSHLFNAHSLIVIGTSLGVVLGLGAWEGVLWCADTVDVGFVWRYAAGNVIPSCVWNVMPAELVAQAMELEEGVLFKPDPNSVDDAKRLLMMSNLQHTRSIVAGFMLLAQVLRGLTLTTLAGEDYKQLRLEGEEAPVHGVGERIVRLCGRASDVTEVSWRRYGHHLLPSFEEPARVKHTLAALETTRRGVRCQFWKVAKGSYGNRHSWQGLVLDEQALVRTSTGKRLLFLEADGTHSEHSLGDGDFQPDLTFHEASKAFRNIARVNAEALAVTGVRFRTVKVFLGPSTAKYTTGGGNVMTLRDRVVLSREVDVLVDSRAPILLALLQWIGRMAQVIADGDEDPGAEGKDVKPSKLAVVEDVLKDRGSVNRFASMLFGTRSANDLHIMCLDTDDAAYFQSLQQLMVPFGFEVKDPFAVPEEDLLSVPYLVYYKATSDTVTAATSLLHARVVDPRRCCVLLDREEGLWDLDEKSKASGIEIVCSAQVLDDLLHQVRAWIRQGHSSADVQHTLDAKFGPVLDALSPSKPPAVDTPPLSPDL